MAQRTRKRLVYTVVLWVCGDRKRDATRHDISRRGSGSRGVKRGREHDARGRRGDRVGGYININHCHREPRRNRPEKGPMLVHAVVSTAAVPGMLDGTPIMDVNEGAASLAGIGDRVSPGMGLLRARRTDHRLDERAGDQSDEKERDPATAEHGDLEPGQDGRVTTDNFRCRRVSRQPTEVNAYPGSAGCGDARGASSPSRRRRGRRSSRPRRRAATGRPRSRRSRPCRSPSSAAPPAPAG